MVNKLSNFIIFLAKGFSVMQETHIFVCYSYKIRKNFNSSRKSREEIIFKWLMRAAWFKSQLRHLEKNPIYKITSQTNQGKKSFKNENNFLRLKFVNTKCECLLAYSTIAAWFKSPLRHLEKTQHTKTYHKQIKGRNHLTMEIIFYASNL